MSSMLMVNSSITIEANCPLRHDFIGDDQVVIMCGEPPADYLELSIAPEALRRLVALGTKALDELT